MKLSTLFSIHAVVAGIFGLAFTLAPESLLSFYGGALNPVGVVVGRLFGSALLGIAAIAWFARNIEAPEARQAIVLALFVSDAVGFIVALLGQLSGVVNALGWTTVAIYLLLALGYGYFQFVRPSS